MNIYVSFDEILQQMTAVAIFLPIVAKTIQNDKQIILRHQEPINCIQNTGVVECPVPPLNAAGAVDRTI